MSFTAFSVQFQAQRHVCQRHVSILKILMKNAFQRYRAIPILNILMKTTDDSIRIRFVPLNGNCSFYIYIYGYTVQAVPHRMTSNYMTALLFL